jgi:hypothetical protein
MLWYKGWLESRWKLLFLLGGQGFILISLYSMASKPAAPGAKPMLGITGIFTIFGTMLTSMLSGSGINTQPSFQAAKGLRGSTYFTLSLPVSRLRLLAIRASLGWLELIPLIGTLCFGIWAAFPIVRATATAAEMLQYAGVVLACSSMFYSISVLLSTFLDELWRVWGTMIAAGSLWLAFDKTRLAEPVNMFRAMGEGSPLLAHTMPWGAMVFSVGMAVVFFIVAWRVVRVREY